MNARTLLIILLMISALFAGCVPTPSTETDIRGDWKYTMIDSGGNTYDMDVITFDGKPEKGTYLEVNIYQVEYEGEFTVNGNNLTLSGEETWQGIIVDADTINGTWSHEKESSNGTFTASRK